MQIHSTPTVYIQNAGALGDTVASLATLNFAAKELHVDDKYFVMAKKYFHDLYFFLPKEKVIDLEKVHSFSEAMAFIPYNKVIKDDKGRIAGEYHPLRMSLWNYASLQLLKRVLPLEKQNYPQYPIETVDLTRFNLKDQDKLVVFTPNFSCDIRKFLTINDVIDHVIFKGFTPVFLGSTKVPAGSANIKYVLHDGVNYDKGYNLMDQTSLVEACAIMGKSKCVIGLDNGLVHLAGMTQVPIVAGYTTMSPELRMPVRHDTVGWNCYAVIPNSDCRYCSDLWQLDGHDFATCYYNTFECTKSIRAEDWIKGFDTLIQ